uniref:GUN4-like domain-containing protein n=1 Tax=Lophocladia kuetzingii TaxID=675577 RepID=A0A1Z1MN88_9FLOR|nr:hypothetical protein [Lophocladia kuetzingii]ARW67557.1 hypothetical protein [Lophocladia kuetzingii]
MQLNQYKDQQQIQEKIYQIFNQKHIILSKETEKIIERIYNKGEKEQFFLLHIIIQRNFIDKKNANFIDGFIFQKLKEVKQEKIKEKVNYFFPNGLISLKSSLNINYQPLQNLLIDQKFQEADQLTQKYLCQLVELKTNQKKTWLYFTDIQFLPTDDLFQLDLLWKIYSKGKFGFSVQKKIWINNNKKWNTLWEKIGWLKKGIMKRYPQEFTWTIEAPTGHLPLSNQLRGTQTLMYLFSHIYW